MTSSGYSIHRPFREDQTSILKTNQSQRFAVHRCLAS
uniref:Uncharacterized protein n=1 Tax=Myoviridae sp. ct3Sw5 TaxID=2826609 RepID=A0A8S5MP22_9CAUD|nr:MAG TPA: hypothetical protein [Myoviridae sp. ct3Sw5]